MIFEADKVGAIARNVRKCRRIEVMEFGVGARGAPLNLRGNVRCKLLERLIKLKGGNNLEDTIRI
jgi:hypothetical protein